MGIGLLKIRNRHAALTIFGKILNKDPNHYKTLVMMLSIDIMNLMKAENDQRDALLKEISSKMNRAFKINPSDPTLLVQISEILHYQNQHEKSKSLLEAALEAVNAAKIHLETISKKTVNVKSEDGKSSTAAQVQSTVKHRVESEDLNRVLAEIYFQLGRYYHIKEIIDKASKYYAESQNAYPKHFAAVYNLALTQYQLKQYTDAECNLEKLILIL